MYSGDWINGKKHGKGTYVFTSTSVRYTGEWHENFLLKGKWVFPNGNYYEGSFENNKPNGRGKWYFKNGNEISGAYDQLIVPDQDGKL